MVKKRKTTENYQKITRDTGYLLYILIDYPCSGIFFILRYISVAPLTYLMSCRQINESETQTLCCGSRRVHRPSKDDICVSVMIEIHMCVGYTLDSRVLIR